MAYHVILENVAGKLDERIVRTEEETRAAALDLIEECAFLSDGDVIRVVEIRG